MKTCIKCHQSKPESDFYRGRNVCKPCVIDHSRAFRRKNLEKSRASARKYKAKHRKHISEMNARYYANHLEECREKRRASDKRFYAKNKTRIREYRRAYYEKNRAKFQEYGRRHRESRKLLSSSLRNSLPIAHGVA